MSGLGFNRVVVRDGCPSFSPPPSGHQHPDHDTAIWPPEEPSDE